MMTDGKKDLKKIRDISFIIFLFLFVINLIGTVKHWLKEAVWWWLDMNFATVISFLGANIEFVNSQYKGLNIILNFLIFDVDIMILCFVLAIIFHFLSREDNAK